MEKTTATDPASKMLRELYDAVPFAEKLGYPVSLHPLTPFASSKGPYVVHAEHELERIWDQAVADSYTAEVEVRKFGR